MTRAIGPHHHSLSLSLLIIALALWISSTLMLACAAWYNHTDLMWFNAISPHSLCEIVLFCFKGNGVWFCGNDPTATPQNNSAGKWWGDVIKQTVVYEKLLAPSGIVECVNHCVEQKGFAIMEAWRQLQQGRELRVGWFLGCWFTEFDIIIWKYATFCWSVTPHIIDVCLSDIWNHWEIVWNLGKLTNSFSCRELERKPAVAKLSLA